MRATHKAALVVVRAVELKDANAFVAQHHRHHKPAVGHRFSLGAFVDGAMVGACIVGRPVARNTNQRTCVEVTRLVTDGTYNACSALYAAAARAAKALGYERIQTFILETEPGTSLKASGWVNEGAAGGGQWFHTGFNEGVLPGISMNRDDQPTCGKTRWAKSLNPSPRPTAASGDSEGGDDGR